MRFHNYHAQLNREEIEQLVKSQPLGLLITSSGGEFPKTGLYNAVLEKDRFYLHLGRTDEQVYDLRKNKLCQFIYSESLSVIPSYWIDGLYGGAINNFFKFAEFQCEARMIEEPKELLQVMQRMMDSYQAEKNYLPLDPEHEVYRDKFKIICAVELKILSLRTKWNLGQTKPLEAQENILKQLKLRNKTSDAKTAMEMRKWKSIDVLR